MLFVLFQIGNERYALDANHVIEIVPFLALKKIPQSPRGVAGIFNYRGRPVPAVDLSELTTGTPSRERLSTRIVLINQQGLAGQSRLLGLIAEHATETLRKDPKEFQETGMSVGAAPYLGPVIMDDKGVIQLLREQYLLEEKLRELLFAPPAEANT